MAQRISASTASLLHVHHDAGRGADEHRAEQAIRFVVIDRHIRQGTRSETGRRWERTDLDDDRHLCRTRPVGVRIPKGMRRELARGSSVAFGYCVGDADMRGLSLESDRGGNVSAREGRRWRLLE